MGEELDGLTAIDRLRLYAIDPDTFSFDIDDAEDAVAKYDELAARADLVEPLVEALDGLVQRFDTFDGQPFVNPADSPWSIARAAIAAYREAAQ